MAKGIAEHESIYQHHEMAGKSSSPGHQHTGPAPECLQSGHWGLGPLLAELSHSIKIHLG
jgi:hypothetical protein